MDATHQDGHNSNLSARAAKWLGLEQFRNLKEGFSRVIAKENEGNSRASRAALLLLLLPAHVPKGA